jgi:hypothetical protein
MLSKILIAISLFLIAVSPSAFSADTLKIKATLDPDLNTVYGSIIIHIPEAFSEHTYELYLPANKFSFGDFDYQKNYSGLDKTGFYASMTIDTVMLGGTDITDRFAVSQTRGTLNCENMQVAGQRLYLRFKTHLPQYGTSLLATDGEFFLGGWFPVPATFRNGKSINQNCSNFADPAGDYYVYDIEFTVPANLVVVAPVPSMNVVVQDDLKIYYYNFGPAVDFALALSSSYIVDSTIQSGIVLKYFYRDFEKELAVDIKNITSFAFSFMNDYVGSYIYPELNFAFINAAQPVALEYPGLIALFSPRGGALVSNYFEYLAIRQVVHQWFYAMISADRCTEPWLDKSVAEYFALKIADNYWGRDANLLDFGGFKATFADNLRLNARVTEGKTPLNLSAGQLVSEIEYGTTIRNRGALTVATIFNLLGDSLTSVFWKSYYERHLLNRASTDSFLTLLEKTAGSDFKRQVGYLLNSTERIDYSVSALSYRQIDSVTYESIFVLSRSGTMPIPVVYKVILYNEDTLSFTWDSEKYSELIRFESPYPARTVIIDPDFLMAVDINLFNNSIQVATDSRPAWRLSSAIMFLIESIFSLIGGW